MRSYCQSGSRPEVPMLESLPFFAVDQAGQVQNLSLRPRRVGLDSTVEHVMPRSPAEDEPRDWRSAGDRRRGPSRSCHPERAWPAAKNLIAEGTQFAVKPDHVFKNVGDIPGDPHAHLDASADAVELFGEGVVVDPENTANSLGAIGQKAESHRQDCVVGHQLLEHSMVGRQPASFGTELLIGQIADDRRDRVVTDRVDHRPVKAEVIERWPSDEPSTIAYRYRPRAVAFIGSADASRDISSPSCSVVKFTDLETTAGR